MDSVAEIAVRRAIEFMYGNFSESITVDSLARAAMYSKFHFTRVFRAVTGVSPGRFLSAIRIQESKRLLVYTDWSVLNISIQVGYNSVGTFSSRFRRIVGCSPTTYRKLDGYAPRLVSSVPLMVQRGDMESRAIRGLLRGGALPRPCTRSSSGCSLNACRRACRWPVPSSMVLDVSCSAMYRQAAGISSAILALPTVRSARQAPRVPFRIATCAPTGRSRSAGRRLSYPSLSTCGR